MKKWFLIISLLAIKLGFSQGQDFNNLLNDATLYSDRYITPMADAAVYQSSSAWMTSAKKRDLWTVTVSVHGNAFFVPQSDKTFQISNSDFKFLQIEGASTLQAQTALGGTQINYLTGNLNLELAPGLSTIVPVRIETPKGIEQNVIIYPYAMASVALWKGTEVAVKYSTKTKLKKGDYQVYGFGIKHNLSQYFKSLEDRKINIATMITLSKEEINFRFLDVQVPFVGSLGIEEIKSKVTTKQIQINASKEYNNWEILAGLIVNNSDFKYEFSGNDSQNVTGLKEILNDKVKEIAKNKTNLLGEVSARYNFRKFYIQPTIAFGKFVNTNFSIQYEF